MSTHLHRGPTPPGKFWNFYSKIISTTWKVLENDLSPGKSWKLLGSSVGGSFWLKMDMLLQAKIAVIVAIRYVFGLQVCQKCFCSRGSFTDPAGIAYSAPHTY